MLEKKGRRMEAKIRRREEKGRERTAGRMLPKESRASKPTLNAKEHDNM